MAGDHKCPVCSSTFTRPQHVARHMRSHTGDRPYKCVHCGDQFARSDLLSRHVNKCHASEKPPTTTQPARRKSHTVTAPVPTTDVRGPSLVLVCEACALSRTPTQCDARLPCANCLQHNIKCVYPKHPAPRHPDAPLTVPSMAPPRPGPTPASIPGPFPFPAHSTFNFSVPAYPQSLDPRSMSAYPNAPYSTESSPSSLSLSTTSSADSLESPTTATLLSPYHPPYPNTSPVPHIPTQYPDTKHLHPSQYYPHYLYSQPPNGATHHYHPQQQQYGAHVFPAPPQTSQPGSDYSALFHPHQHPESAHPHPQAHSNPAPFVRGDGHGGPAAFLADTGVSSALGRLSLDDPVLAAEMRRSSSFFAPPPPGREDAAVPNDDDNGVGSGGGDRNDDTPTGGAAVRDASLTELRDVWRAFMRDNTPNAAEKSLLPLQQQLPPPQHQQPQHAQHVGAISLRRKAPSLPDIKTPQAAGGGPGPGPVPGPPGPAYSTVEETREDLVLYQQAVLAAAGAGAAGLTLRLPPQPLARKRPSVKRLASSTLGPFESKTAKVWHQDGGGSGSNGGAEEDRKGKEEEGEEERRLVEATAMTMEGLPIAGHGHGLGRQQQGQERRGVSGDGSLEQGCRLSVAAATSAGMGVESACV